MLLHLLPCSDQEQLGLLEGMGFGQLCPLGSRFHHAPGLLLSRDPGLLPGVADNPLGLLSGLGDEPGSLCFCLSFGPYS